MCDQSLQVIRSPNHWWASSCATSPSSSCSRPSISSISAASVMDVAEMFSMPPPKLGQADLGILGIGIGLAGLLVEETDHRRRLAHESPGRGLVHVLGHVIIDGQARRPDRGKRQNRKRPARSGSDVGTGPSSSERSWCCRHSPWSRPGRRWTATKSGFCDRDDHLGGGPIVRIVVAGEPVVRVLGLALGPDGQGLLGIGRVGMHEVEPGSGEPGVFDRQVEGIVGP